MDEHRIGTGTEAGMETRAVAEMGTDENGNADGNEDGIEDGRGERSRVRNRTRVVDTIR